MFTFTIRPDGEEPYDVVADSRDIVRWEKIGGGRTLGKFEGNASMTWISEIAFCAALRQGLYSGDRPTFVADIAVELHPPKKRITESLGDGEDGEDLGPTRTDR